MKNPITAILLFFVTLVGCSQHDTGFTLHGIISGGGNDTVFVTGIDSRYDRVDTIPVKDGVFTYKCDADTVIPLLLLYRDGRQDAVFADRNLTANYTVDSTGVGTVDAGIYNLQLADFLREAAGDSTYAQIINRIDSFIEKNPLSELSPYLIYRYCLRRNDIDKSRVMALTDKMSGLMHDNPLIADIRTEFGKSTRTFYQFTDYNMADTSFRKVSEITDLHERSLNMLVCIWASWDSLSREANRAMNLLAEEYSKKKLAFAGLSIDTDRERWKAAIQTDSLESEQLIDWQGWNSNVVVQMNIERLPYYILLGPSGRILGKSYSIGDLRTNIEELDERKKSDIRKKTIKTAFKTVARTDKPVKSGGRSKKPNSVSEL